MEKIIHRLKEYIDNKGLRESEFEKLNGLANQYISKTLERGSDMRESTVLKILDNNPDLDKDWFIFGKTQGEKSNSLLDRYEVEIEQVRRMRQSSEPYIKNKNNQKTLETDVNIENYELLIKFLKEENSKLKKEMDFYIIENQRLKKSSHDLSKSTL